MGDQEHLVLRTVWQLRRCTVRAVFEQVGEPQGLAYTTIATVLDRLYDKGFVSRVKDGKAFLYKPAKKQASVEKARAKSLVGRFLGAEPIPAVANLVEAVEAVDPALLDRLAEEIQRCRGRRGS